MDRKISERIIIINLVMNLVIAMYHFGSAATASVAGYDGPVNTLVTRYINLAADVAMDWFFTVTGLLLFKNYSMKTYPQKLRRRVMTVLVPYIIWQVLFCLVDWPEGGAKGFIDTVFLFGKYPPDGPLWYMYAVFCLAVLSPLFYLPMKSKRFGLLFTVLGILGAYYMQVSEIPLLSKIHAAWGCCQYQHPAAGLYHGAVHGPEYAG